MSVPTVLSKGCRPDLSFGPHGRVAYLGIEQSIVPSPPPPRPAVGGLFRAERVITRPSTKGSSCASHETVVVQGTGVSAETCDHSHTFVVSDDKIPRCKETIIIADILGEAQIRNNQEDRNFVNSGKNSDNPQGMLYVIESCSFIIYINP